MDRLFVYANYVEAALWVVLAIVAVLRRNGGASFVLAAALLAFGISDVVETRTGGWYRPWWLLAWKVACVLAIAISGLGVIRKRRASVLGGQA